MVNHTDHDTSTARRVSPKVTFDQELPVTMVVTRLVKPGERERFEQWLHAVAADAMTFEGHLGLHVIRPGDASAEYTIIFRFGTPGQLRAWLDSDVRARHLREAESFFADEGQVQQLSGLEAWFSLPGRPAATPPPRYKMALVTFAAVFSLLMLIQRLVAPLLEPLPPVARTFVVCVTMVTLLTYLVMPRLTRALSGWLYRRRSAGASR
jgi:antibiotic biosynthesis monooxygenase (ABM) superfamily enzyme